MEKINSADLKCIEMQLGRTTESVHKIATRCKAFDLPEIIITKPVVYKKGRPVVFTTVYWMSCPFLKKAVSILESEQWISKLANHEPEKMKQAHAACLEDRKKLLKELEIDPSELPETMSEPLLNTGIGGIRPGGGHKCLHLHTAHYLATGNNPIGELVIKELKKRGLFCKTACYKEDNK